MSSDQHLSKTDIRAQVFADEFLANGAIGVRAAQKLGLENYGSACTEAKRLLRNAQVQARIRERLGSAYTLAIAEPIGAMVEYLRGDLTDCFPQDDQTGRSSQQYANDIIEHIRAKKLGRLLKKVRFKRRYEKSGKDLIPVDEVELEAYSALEAGRTLGTWMGLGANAGTSANLTVNVLIVQEKVTTQIKAFAAENGLDESAALEVWRSVAPEQVKMLEG